MSVHPALPSTVLLALLVVTGCSPGAGPAGPASEARVGPEGGRVTLDDGAVLVVPANAVAEEVTISAKRLESPAAPLPDGTSPIGSTYRFTPHGLTFSVPVELQLPVPAATTDAQVVFLADDEDRIWESAGAATISDGAVRISVAHLSHYAAVPAECNASSHCRGHDCVNGWCTGRCQLDTHCTGGKTCEDGWCGGGVAGCMTSNDCPTGHNCKEGSCVAPPDPPTACTDNSQCPTGVTCADGYCGPIECSSNAMCPSGLSCKSGYCEKVATCTTGADCPGLAACVTAGCNVCQGGTCVPCGSDGNGEIFCP